MFWTCRTVAAAVAVAAVCGNAAIAHAQTSDERFQEVVNSMGITAGPDTDLPAMGRAVCDTLTQQMAVNPNPAPLVRGIVASLEDSNLTREQAVGFMKASVATYCPQHYRLTGR
ncbi:DUF732 domain-containing protein [Mycolicibacterium sp. S2-37]|uniref:DUF732 domain-containing protein n=1 Tax=Mycolicibacterium sp. S2-37 TaxID=2810297 RepID=UPI001A93CE6D|nr:DUF732 domain-containing protein [Mycolicibacterium sp. S2-37]MBO0678909.1 DUF732 domain-containing protein [Mycolicibacterium sp. S2-37]